jgi:hypothetical protein
MNWISAALPAMTSKQSRPTDAFTRWHRMNHFKCGGISTKWGTEKISVFAECFAEFEVRALSGNGIMAQKMQTLLPTNIFLPMVKWKRGRAGLKEANRPLDSKVVNCGICQQPGHSRGTFPRVTAFLADKDGQERYLKDAVEVSFIKKMN